MIVVIALRRKQVDDEVPPVIAVLQGGESDL
jgi:hypothetical protein